MNRIQNVGSSSDTPALVHQLWYNFTQVYSALILYWKVPEITSNFTPKYPEYRQVPASTRRYLIGTTSPELSSDLIKLYSAQHGLCQRWPPFTSKFAPLASSYLHFHPIKKTNSAAKFAPPCRQQTSSYLHFYPKSTKFTLSQNQYRANIVRSPIYRIGQIVVEHGGTFQNGKQSLEEHMIFV